VQDLGFAVGLVLGCQVSGLAVGFIAGLLLSGSSRVMSSLISLSLLATARGGASFLLYERPRLRQGFEHVTDRRLQLYIRPCCSRLGCGPR